MAEAIETAGELVAIIANRGETITAIPSRGCTGINIKTQHIFAGKHSAIPYTLQGVVAGCAIVS